MASDAKTGAEILAGCTLELVTGAPRSGGHTDGALPVGRFNHPMSVCLWTDTLFVTDSGNGIIRAIDGITAVGVGSLHALGGNSAARTSLMALIVEGAPVLLKELVAIIADYARPIGVRTIAGSPANAGTAGGHALREAKFNSPMGMAIDESDPVAGPQLIIADYGNNCVRSLHLRSEQATTIAGDCKTKDGVGGHVDGPPLKAQFSKPIGTTVDPLTGVIFVAEQVPVPSSTLHPAKQFADSLAVW
jgi:hypothetical protein